MFKVNNKDTKTPIVNFEYVITGWVGLKSVYLQSSIQDPVNYLQKQSFADIPQNRCS